MRIIGEISHPILKITVFVMNMKYSIKLEMGTLEQIFKLRESDHIKGFDDIEKIVDEIFIQECIDRFTAMHVSMGGAFKRNIV